MGSPASQPHTHPQPATVFRKRSAQRRRREGVSDRRPNGSRRLAARCAAQERGTASPETHGIVEPQNLFLRNPTKSEIGCTPLRRPVKAQGSKIIFTTATGN